MAPAAAWRWIPRGLVLGLLAFAIFGPIINLALWAVAERWYWPHALPSQYGFEFWGRVFSERGHAWESLGTSVFIALLTVAVSLLISAPAGYALARLSVPFRGLMMLAFLLPQAFPNLPIYINIARIFYWIGLNGTILGVVLVHSLHGLVLSVWIAAAAFASVDRSLEEAARNMGADPIRAFFTVSLPLAAPGIMAAAVFVFLELARRVYRHLFRRRAGCDHLTASHVQRLDGWQLPDRSHHRADPAHPVRRIHARHRAISKGGCHCQDRRLTGG